MHNCIYRIKYIRRAVGKKRIWQNDATTKLTAGLGHIHVDDGNM